MDPRQEHAGMTSQIVGAIQWIAPTAASICLRDPPPSCSYTIHDTIIHTGIRRRRTGIRPQEEIP